MKKLLIITLTIILIISTFIKAQTQPNKQPNKMIFQEFLVIEDNITSKQYIYSTLYNIRYDLIYETSPSYTYIYKFSKYPLISIIALDHKQKIFKTSEYDTKKEFYDVNQYLKQIFKDMKSTEKNEKTIVNEKQINSIKYIITYQNVLVMEISVASINDILNEQDSKDYKQIISNNQFDLNMPEVFKQIDIIDKIYQKTREGFAIVEITTQDPKFTMKLNQLKIIDYNPMLFEIPQDYQQEKEQN